jgi:hypothetical protein
MSSSVRTIRRRFVAVVLALAVVACLVRAGARSFYCPFTDTVSTEHCCAQHPLERASTVRPPDCCKVRTAGALPVARAPAPAADLPTPPRVAVVVGRLPDAASGSTPPARLAVARRGRAPPSATRSAQQIVLRI